VTVEKPKDWFQIIFQKRSSSLGKIRVPLIYRGFARSRDLHSNVAVRHVGWQENQYVGRSLWACVLSLQKCGDSWPREDRQRYDCRLKLIANIDPCSISSDFYLPSGMAEAGHVTVQRLFTWACTRVTSFGLTAAPFWSRESTMKWDNQRRYTVDYYRICSS